jgi:hypothetical protein
MQVVTIAEDNHGQIGIAKTYVDAVHFLVNENWFNETFEIYDSGFCDTVQLGYILGEEWLSAILSWTIEKFNEYFDGCFYLRNEKVYEVK